MQMSPTVYDVNTTDQVVQSPTPVKKAMEDAVHSTRCSVVYGTDPHIVFLVVSSLCLVSFILILVSFFLGRCSVQSVVRRRRRPKHLSSFSVVKRSNSGMGRKVMSLQRADRSSAVGLLRTPDELRQHRVRRGQQQPQRPFTMYELLSLQKESYLRDDTLTPDQSNDYTGALSADSNADEVTRRFKVDPLCFLQDNHLRLMDETKATKDQTDVASVPLRPQTRNTSAKRVHRLSELRNMNRFSNSQSTDSMNRGCDASLSSIPETKTNKDNNVSRGEDASQSALMGTDVAQKPRSFSASAFSTGVKAD